MKYARDVTLIVIRAGFPSMIGYVYSARCTWTTDVCKIGCTTHNPHDRVKQFQGMRGERMFIEDFIITTRPNHYKLETHIHKLLEKHKEPKSRDMPKCEYFVRTPEQIKELFSSFKISSRLGTSLEDSSEDFEKVSESDSEDYVVDKILSHELRGDDVYYETRWEDGSVSFEPLYCFIFDGSTGEVCAPLEKYWKHHPESRPDISSLILACQRNAGASESVEGVYSFSDD